MRRNRIRDLFSYRSLRLKIRWALKLSPSPWAYSLWLHTSQERPSRKSSVWGTLIHARALIPFAFQNLDLITCANCSCIWLTSLFVPAVEFLEALSVSQFRQRSFKRRRGTDQRSMLPLSEMIPDTEFPIWLTAMQAEYMSHLKWISAHKSLRLFCASHSTRYEFLFCYLKSKREIDIKPQCFSRSLFGSSSGCYCRWLEPVWTSISNLFSDSQDL